MSKFSVAMIRFSANGRLYPVNCAFDAKPGQRVIVRMAGQAHALQRAEVVETRDFRKPCRNSVVCYAEDAEAYGKGPPGVETAADLERYLTFQNWTRYSTAPDERGIGPKSRLHEQWPAAYISPTFSSNPDRLWGPSLIVALGPSGVSRRYLNDETCAHLLDGKLVVDFYFWEFGKDGGNPFREAAEFVERKIVIEDYDPPAGNSLREIRRAISDGGPVYLSDDVWI